MAAQTLVDDARTAFEGVRQARLQANAQLAAQAETLAALQRTLPASDPRLIAAIAGLASQQAAVSAARAAENAAVSSVTAALSAFLTADVPSDVGRLDSRCPIVLLPVRVETRFIAGAARRPTRGGEVSVPGTAPQLLVRIYPDEIAADSHEPELSAEESAAGQAYWTAAAPGGEQLAAWQALLRTYPSQRAAWIVRATDPSQSGPAPSFYKPSGWSRAVEARLQPDRYMVVATRGTVTRQAVGALVVEPVALTLGPDSLSSDQVPIDPEGTLKLDDAVRWTLDFDAAVANGMAIRLPIDADDLRSGFDRVIVVGVKTSMDPTTTSQRLAALMDAQHYTSGLAFVKQGTPTSNAIGTPAGFPPADANWAVQLRG